MPAVEVARFTVPVAALMVRPVVEVNVPAVAPVPSVAATVPVLPAQLLPVAG